MTSQTSSSRAADLRKQWETEGYVQVPRLIGADEAARLNTICEFARAQWSRCDATRGESFDDDTQTNMRHVNHPAYFPGRRDLLVPLLEIIADDRVLDVCRAVFGEEPVFYCTTLFFNPRISRNGNWHRDSQFMTKTDDEERQLLFDSGDCKGLQLQIALVPSEDCEVIPGSQLRWDTDAEYRIRKADNCRNWESDDMPGALRVALQPGDAVAFNPFALHRGRYHADKKRRTLMLTYQRASSTAEDTYFSRQPWMLEDGHLEGLSPRARRVFEAFIARNRSLWDQPPKWTV
jgi:ectoine hydroxylase-related dioxygenase (phytanoyl-CoA dioxygenase family)